ncbi:MAG: hypothetical protein E7D48_12345 [Bifidobacterium scardovii]|uniref:hypothetical protein n=1 Tax=Bifidobacterium scardovii TaxID=158787 RepID=UPI002902EA21|nr:hypothetical protein [Bifidobacterium scardovii]MDU2422868.1 hypothetical protein [Bifidobacterium scardovii]
MPEANGNSNEPTLAERVFAEQSASLSQPPADTASTGEPHAVGANSSSPNGENSAYIAEGRSSTVHSASVDGAPVLIAQSSQTNQSVVPVNVTSPVDVTLKTHEGVMKKWGALIVSIISLILSLISFGLSTFISYSNGIVDRNAELTYSGPDATVVKQLDSMKAELPYAAVQLFNSGVGSAYNIRFTNSNANIYAIVYVTQESAPTLLTSIPRLAPGEQATVLFYPPSEKLNGIPPKSATNGTFTGTGEIKFDYTYSEEVSHEFFNRQKIRTTTKTLTMWQDTDDANVKAEYAPVALMPDRIGDAKTEKVLPLKQFPNTGR